MCISQLKILNTAIGINRTTKRALIVTHLEGEKKAKLGKANGTFIGNAGLSDLISVPFLFAVIFMSYTYS